MDDTTNDKDFDGDDDISQNLQRRSSIHRPKSSQSNKTKSVVPKTNSSISLSFSTMVDTMHTVEEDDCSPTDRSSSMKGTSGEQGVSVSTMSTRSLSPSSSTNSFGSDEPKKKEEKVKRNQDRFDDDNDDDDDDDEATDVVVTTPADRNSSNGRKNKSDDSRNNEKTSSRTRSHRRSVVENNDVDTSPAHGEKSRKSSSRKSIVRSKSHCEDDDTNCRKDSDRIKVVNRNKSSDSIKTRRDSHRISCSYSIPHKSNSTGATSPADDENGKDTTTSLDGTSSHSQMSSMARRNTRSSRLHREEEKTSNPRRESISVMALSAALATTPDSDDDEDGSVARRSSFARPIHRRPSSISHVNIASINGARSTGTTSNPNRRTSVSRQSISRQSISRQSISRQSISRQSVSRQSMQLTIHSEGTIPSVSLSHRTSRCTSKKFMPNDLFHKMLDVNPFHGETLDEDNIDIVMELMKDHPKLCAKKYLFSAFSSEEEEDGSDSESDSGSSFSGSDSSTEGKKPNVTSRKNHRIYPLHMLCALGAPVCCIRLCLKSYPAACQFATTTVGTPIHYACWFHHREEKTEEESSNTPESENLISNSFELVRFLVKLKSSLLVIPNESNHQTPLHLACLAAARRSSAGKAENEEKIQKEEECEIIRHLLKVCPRLAMEADNAGDTPLHIACNSKHPNFLLIERLVTLAPATCLAVNNLEATPLHLALRSHADIQIVQYLIRTNSDSVRVFDRKNNLPIHVAVEANTKNIDIYKILIEPFYESLYSKNKNGETPYRIAKSKQLGSPTIEILTPKGSSK